MCGLAGIISLDGVEPRVLAAMGESLRHRGPDGRGVLFHSVTEGPRIGFDGEPSGMMAGAVAGFVHRRLKILDLTDAARQPMADNGVALVFNGEIYNYRDLRHELEGEGFEFSSSGDTEVVLKAYRAWGASCFERFAGMWALAILDVPNNRVVLSRDRFGIKPLYLAQAGGAFLFASEIKALLASPHVGRMPNERTVARYLGLGILDDGENTFFKDISRFPAAHWAEVSLETPGSGPVFHRYWRLEEETFRDSEPAAVERFGNLFQDAVASHHHSDVPSGSCLSGGLDSSAIVCTAATFKERDDFANHTWKAFGHVPSDERISERGFMETAATAAGADLDTVSVDDTAFLKTLPKILAAHDEPVGSASACAQWFVFERANEAGVRVMLDGQGADEMLGGYLGYLLTVARGALAGGRLGDYMRLRDLYNAEVGPFPLSISRVLADAFLPSAFRRRLLARKGPGFTAMTPGLAHLARHETATDLTPRHDLKATLAADLQARILPALLRYEDANSMAHSIEARVPFLDHRLVEFAFSLPDGMKVNGTTRKRVLREAMKGTVPEAIRTRTDKIGFKASLSWTFSLASKHRHEFVDNVTEYERAWFDGEGLRRLFQAENFTDALESPLWRVINLKQWVRSL